MMPPTRLEQLGNFQDSIQSPEGLERLRALQYIQSALPSSQGLMGMPQVSAPVVARQYGGEVGTGGFVGTTNDGVQIFDNSEQGILNRSIHGGILEGQQQTTTAPSGFSGGSTTEGAQEIQSMSDVTPLASVATDMPASLMEMPSVQERGGVYNASEFRDAGVDLATPAGIPETIIQQGQPQTTIRDFAGNIPYDLYVPQPVNTYAQGYDLGGMDYFTANQLALNSGADRFMYGGKYAAVDPGLLSNYKDNMDAGFSEETAYGMIKPYITPTRLSGVSYSGDAEKLGNFNLPQNPNSPAAMKAQGYKMGPTGQFIKDTSTYAPLTDYERNYLGMKYRAGGGQIADTAQGLASFGRYGDNILVHMNPEELSGLASLGQITYNPVTGLPEAFSLKGLFKGIRKIAPIALAVAAPYALGGGAGLGLFAGTPGAGMSALSFGLATGIGSVAGNLIAGAKPGDALKSGLISGAIGGIGQGISTGNWTGSTAAKGLQTTKIPLSEGQNLVRQTTGIGGRSIGQFGGQGTTSTGLASAIDKVPTGDLVQRISKSPLVTDTSQAFKNIGADIARDYGNLKGAAKLVGMDLMSTDWQQQYANEAKQKEMELQKAGYTVDTDFDGQTVIRDSQGVIMPRNLTASMILDRALGRSPRQRMVSRYGYGQAKHGGLISLAHGGEFSGQVPGDGHGMEDNVYMPIKEGSEQVGTLAVSPSEYVIDSYTMAALGNGNTDEGAKVMDKVVKHVRKKAYGTTKQPNEISGLKTLEPMMERV